MEILFWGSAALVLYVYLGYPLVLALWARAAGAGFRRRAAESDHVDGTPGPAPGVSIVVAVRNEAHRLPARVENLASLDYPGDRQIIVVSDGSTDDPVRALQGAPGDVEILLCEARGKAAALNAGVARARHDLLVFADARQTFAPDALRMLVAPFADERVGGVTGELLLDAEVQPPQSDSGAPVAEGVGLYWKYEKALRRRESAVGSTLGATGAIYALRKSLWQPLPEETLLDDVLAPMRAVLAGRRIVFEDRAKAYDHASPDAATESRRKVRTLAGNVQILWLEPRLLLPLVNPVWVQYMSHKVGRLAVPYALIALFISSALLAGQHWIYTAALSAQCAFYALALYGAWLAASTPARPLAVDVYRGEA